MNQPESQLQQAFFQWWDHAHAGLYCPADLMFAIPNGGARHIATAVRMKREGVRAGVPDVLLCVPSGDWHGLFIEFKAGKKGRVSDEQARLHGVFGQNGYKVAVCRTLDEAIEAVENHLK